MAKVEHVGLTVHQLVAKIVDLLPPITQAEAKISCI